jgi:predicted component of type VI protein secretion system
MRRGVHRRAILRADCMVCARRPIASEKELTAHMPKLVLLFEGRVLKETAVSHTAAVTIGRLPDNTIVIDNPAVSSHHLRIAREGPQFVVEDLESTNGTFVNGAKVTKRALRHGDTILVGKHKIFFDRMGEAEFEGADLPGRDMPDFGGTVILDADQQQRLLAAAQARIQARTAAHQVAAAVPVEETAAPAPPPPPPPAIGRLHVLRGRSDLSEYRLDATTAAIGKDDGALVRLRGWFKPRLALEIARMGESYVATPVAGRTLVNGQRLQGRRGLVHGDVLEVAGLELEFRLSA